MNRPDEAISFLSDQCKPDRSFNYPVVTKGQALAMLRYIKWLEDDVVRLESIMLSCDPVSPSTVHGTAQAGASGEDIYD